MVRVNLNDDEIVERVYQRYQDGTFPLNEQGVSFLLGYHLSQDSQSTVGFELGVFGSLEASFSPDLDVIVADDELVGYEVKGYRSDNRKVSKGQLYKGLGQAVTLLNQPIAIDGGALSKVSLVYPEKAEFNKSNWQWKQNFIDSVKETPVGLATVGTDGVNTVVEPSKNPFYTPSIQSDLLTTLRDQATGMDRRHPENGLRNLALEIEKDNKKRSN